MEYKQIVAPTLKELFIEEIEKQILSEELKIGDKLPPEREIAQNMHISRSVVNSGIVEMERKGFLTIVPRQGTYVADYKTHATSEILVSIMKYGSLSQDYIRSTLEVRDIFMTIALEKAVPTMSKEQFQSLLDACQRFQDAKTTKQGAEELYNIDCCIVDASGNVLLPILISSFKIPNTMLFERYLKLYGFEPMRRRNVLLLQYIELKDTQNAIKVMHDSIMETIDGKTQIYMD